MVEATLFHGTERQRGQRLLDNKRMEMSRGDKHWLGDGSYFFEEDFYAYKWIYDMFEEYFKKPPEDNNELSEKYAIIQGRLVAERKRIFDLDKTEYKIEFDRVYENCKRKKSASLRLAKVKFPEGVVINIMFEEMGYGKNYDVIQCTFKMREGKYSGIKMRLNCLPQKQICVRNLDCIEPFSFYDFIVHIARYEFLMDEYNKNAINKMTYTTKKKSLYKRQLFVWHIIF